MHSDMWTCMWVGVVVVALWLLGMAFDPPRRKKRVSGAALKRKERRPPIAVQTDDTPVDADDVYRIAGITFRCQPADVGGFFGTVEPEPDNPHDPDALAIYRDDGKQLGYIPAADHQRFKARFGAIDGSRLHLVGVIAVDAHAPIYGRVLVLAGNSVAYDARRSEAFVEHIVARHGRDFTPRRFECPC